VLHELYTDPGYVAELQAVGNAVPTSTASPTVTTDSANVGDIVIGFVAAESTTAITGDSDTTNGSWSAQQTTTAGSGTTGNKVSSQRKVCIGAGTQSYDPTWTTAADECIGWARLRANQPRPPLAQTRSYRALQAVGRGANW